MKTLGIGYFGRPSDVGKRDAFHTPAMLVIARSAIMPGDKLTFDDLEKSLVRKTVSWALAKGIADPFLQGDDIPSYTPFWMLLKPGLVVDLTHHFLLDDEEENKAIDANALKDKIAELQRLVDDQEDDGCAGCY